MTDVTRIINAIQQGDKGATDELLPLVYEEMRRVAAQMLSQEPTGQTLQATALVHEAYLRLVQAQDQDWNGRGHFFMVAAEAMRRILVENARRKKSLKGGGNRQRISLDGLKTPFEVPPDDLLALDEALSKLAQKEPEVAVSVKLRYFAGLEIKQISSLRGVSSRTVLNHLSYARAWLHREIAGDGTPSSP